MTRIAVLRRSFPTPGLMLRWIGKSRRRICCVALVLLAIVAGLPVWWATQLMALPDIGDPFDVAAFRSFTIPEDRNAFVLYRQAATLLEPGAEYLKTPRTSVELFARWSKADAQLRRLVEENRERTGHLPQGHRAARCARPSRRV